MGISPLWVQVPPSAHMLTKEEKEKIIEKYKVHKLDSGSYEVQIALLTEEIRKLVLHLKTHPKDFHSKRGLLSKVAKRRKLLRALEKESKKRYQKLIKELGIKK